MATKPKKPRAELEEMVMMELRKVPHCGSGSAPAPGRWAVDLAPKVPMRSPAARGRQDPRHPIRAWHWRRRFRQRAPGPSQSPEQVPRLRKVKGLRKVKMLVGAQPRRRRQGLTYVKGVPISTTWCHCCALCSRQVHQIRQLLHVGRLVKR
jgi:hypothetical protein